MISVWWALRALFRPEPWPVRPAQLIVVAGAAVRPDGTASPALARRVTRAVELYERGVAPVIVVSGGVVTFEPAEALVGVDLARSLGVPEQALIAEVKARDTVGNARETAGLGLGSSVVVVTDDFHLLRAALCFRRYFRQVQAVPCRSPGPLRRLPREALALLVDAVRTIAVSPPEVAPKGPYQAPPSSR